MLFRSVSFCHVFGCENYIEIKAIEKDIILQTKICTELDTPKITCPKCNQEFKEIELPIILTEFYLEILNKTTNDNEICCRNCRRIGVKCINQYLCKENCSSLICSDCIKKYLLF